MADAVRAWERFWFEPQPTSTVAVFRIAFGILAFAWTATLGIDLLDFFGDHAVAPQPDWNEAGRGGVWGLFDVLPTTDAAVIGVWAAMLVAAACLTVGYHSRLASLIVFAGIVSLERRNPFIFNGGDFLLRLLAFYVVLMPTGAALSVDRWRKHRDRFWEFPARAPFGIRLVQVQLSIVYLAAVWAKVRGVTWNDGTAVSYAFRLEDLQRFPVPEELTTSLFVSNLLTYGTLAVELAVPILIWTRLRPLAMVLGIGLHLGIDYAIRVGYFTFAILLPYLAFVPPERMSELVLGLRDRVAARAERRRARERVPATPAVRIERRDA